MSQGRLVAFTPQAISGYSTPVITEHLKPGSITYNANGGLNQIGGRRKRSGYKRSGYKHSSTKYKKRSSRKYKRSSRKYKKNNSKKRTRKY